MATLGTPKNCQKTTKRQKRAIRNGAEKKDEKKAEMGTCLSTGTGSAFKDGGLQGDGLKAVLATAVVFGRACGAASTTLANE